MGVKPDRFDPQLRACDGAPASSSGVLVTVLQWRACEGAPVACLYSRIRGISTQKNIQPWPDIPGWYFEEVPIGLA